MLWNTSLVRGYAIEAHDGPLGAICDLFFSDHDWRIRWLVVESGEWLAGRKVLLHPSALRRPVRELRQFPVALHAKQVKAAPLIDTNHPVSRQIETSLFDHYGWDPDWAGSGDGPACARDEDGRGLLSIDTVAGYDLCASDGEIGRVQDFIVDDSTWAVRHVVADTQNWWPGQMVLIAPSAIRTVDEEQGTIHLRVNRQKIKDSPMYGTCRIVDQKFEDMIAGSERRASV